MKSTATFTIFFTLYIMMMMSYHVIASPSVSEFSYFCSLILILTAFPSRARIMAQMAHKRSPQRPPECGIDTQC